MSIKLFVLVMLVICVMACGCIANGATDEHPDPTGQASTANMTAVSPTIDPGSINATATPSPAADNVTTATPSPVVPASNSGNSSVVSPGLPPAVIFTHVPACGSNDILTGTVTGVDPSKCDIAVFIYVDGLYNVPSDDDPVTTINSDGSWECNISDGGFGDMATEIDAFLLPAGFSVPITEGIENVNNDIKDNALACNSVVHKPANT